MFKKLLAGACVMLAGCGDVGADYYANKGPKLDIREYLNGPLEVQGVFSDYKGRVDRIFKADLHGSWEGDSGELKESFIWNDGTTEERVWKITFQDDHHFTATAHDVIGKAEGKQYGNTVYMSYTLRIQRDSGDTIDVVMDDRLYLTPDNMILNTAYMKKFGLTVGVLTSAFTKKSKDH